MTLPRQHIFDAHSIVDDVDHVFALQIYSEPFLDEYSGFVSLMLIDVLLQFILLAVVFFVYEFLQILLYLSFFIYASLFVGVRPAALVSNEICFLH